MAARHAQRFVEAGIGHVADLGCGLGADAMALASMDLVVTAVEMDEATAACATMNLILFRNATVVHSDATSVSLEGIDGVWLDPARRTTSTSGTKRIWDPEDFSPPLSFVESLAGSGRAVGGKMGPGMPHDSVQADCEAQWVSVSTGTSPRWTCGSTRCGAPRAARGLLVIGPSWRRRTDQREDFNAGPTAPVGPVEGYLYEPDGAVIRAGLVADVALQLLDGHLVDEHIAYICAPELRETPFARAYRVLEVMPFNVKALKSWVKDRGIGVLDIKKRGTAVTPEELRKQPRPRESLRFQGQGEESSHPGPHQDRRGPGGHLGGAGLARRRRTEQDLGHDLRRIPRHGRNLPYPGRTPAEPAGAGRGMQRRATGPA